VVPACKSAPNKRMEAQAPVESIDEAELALADNERRLQELGIVPPSKAGDDGLGYTEGEEESVRPDSTESTTSTSTDAPALTSKAAAEEDGSTRRSTGVASRCTRICDIAESTCALAQQVCDLAARHPDKPRYAKACERAEQQCDVATEACETCE